MNRSYVEFARRLATIVACQVFDGQHNENQRYGHHQETEGDVSCVLDTGFTRRESSGINMVDCSVTQDEG